MSAMPVILRELMAAGLAGEALIAAMERIDAAMNPSNDVLERRRAKDRERKRIARENKTCPRNSAESMDIMESADNAESAETAPPSSSSSPPITPLITTPTPSVPSLRSGTAAFAARGVGITDIEDETALFRRGKVVLGTNAGGQIRNLLRAKRGSVAEARLLIEMAAGKENPREYVAAAIRRGEPESPVEREKRQRREMEAEIYRGVI